MYVSPTSAHPRFLVFTSHATLASILLIHGPLPLTYNLLITPGAQCTSIQGIRFGQLLPTA